MRKIICVFVMICMLTSLVLVACSDNSSSEDATISMYVPDGAPALSVATLLADGVVDSGSVDVTIVNSSEISAKVISETADMAILPTNMASILYNSGEPYQLVSVNTFGLMYIVSSCGEVTLDELVGEVLYCIGLGSVPQYVLEKVLSSNDIEYEHSATAIEGKVALYYFSSGADVIPQLALGTAKYAMLGEPAATKSITVGANMGNTLEIAIDLQQEWSAVSGSYGYAQAGLFVKTELLENNADLVAEICARLEGNYQFLVDNVDSIEQLLTDNNSTDLAGTTFTVELLERCNVGFEYATDVTGDIYSFLQVMYDVSADSVGGQLPDDDFIGKVG